jgi:hypothetical protein
LGSSCEEKFVVGSVWTPEAQTREAEYPLEMCEQHLDFLPPATGLRVFRSCGVRAGHVAGVFMQIPGDLAGDIVGAALRFEFADVAVQFAGAIDPCPRGRYTAPGSCVGAPELNQFLAPGQV